MSTCSRSGSHPVIAHVDLDAFYAQVEVQRNPELRGKPMAVVQYNPFGDLRTITPDESRIFNNSNGSLIAVSYEARPFGVKRNMRGDDARKVCAELQLVQVPTANGKADLTIYREGGARVIEILARGGVCERASIDEAYLDVTEEAHRRLAQSGGHLPIPINSEECFVYGTTAQWNVCEWLGSPEGVLSEADALLACGATVVAELRHAIRMELGYSCSAGIAHNKLLAKLCSSLHKPSKQTILPEGSVQSLLDPLPLTKLRSLGGKFGQTVTGALQVETVGQLAAVPLSRLEALFGLETGGWLHRVAHGVHSERVTQRKLPKSLGCSKTFRAQHVIRSLEDAQHWLSLMAKEVSDRIVVDEQQHHRTPRMLNLGISAVDGHISRSCSVPSVSAEGLGRTALGLFRRWAADQKGFAVTAMGIAVSNFLPVATTTTITHFFSRPTVSGAVGEMGSPAEMYAIAEDEVADGEELGLDPHAEEDGAVDLPGDALQEPPLYRERSVPIDGSGGGEDAPQGTLSHTAATNSCVLTVKKLDCCYQHLAEADISQEVLAELPPDIRREVLNSLTPQPSFNSKRNEDRKRARSSTKEPRTKGPPTKCQPPMSIFAVPQRLLRESKSEGPDTPC